MKSLIAGLIILLIFSTQVEAQTLCFEEVLKQAVENSYDLQISKIDVGISEAGVKEARAEYFPVISLNYNAGYDRDLSDGGSTITPVGDSILLNNTRYQNSASASLQYNLFDFGVRGKKLKIAKKDRTQKQTRYSMDMRDLKLQLADTYTQSLLKYREYLVNKQLLSLNTELFDMQERLYDAGKASKTNVIEQALKVARITNKIDTIRTEYRKNLEDLSFFTGEKYNIENLELEYFKEPGFEPVNLKTYRAEAIKNTVLDLENLPEYKYYQLEIEKKQAELSILNRQRLPHFKFYTNYYLYGTDKDDYWGTLGDIEDTNLSFRIATTLPVFTGFKNTAQRERAKLEIERLKKQQEKKLKEVEIFYQKMRRESEDYKTVLSNQENSLALVKEKIAMLERLNEQKLIDKISYIEQKTDLISQKLELERVKINNNANEYKLHILKPSEEELCKQD